MCRFYYHAGRGKTKLLIETLLRALKSPAILEHSGIGRKEVLANAHVPQKLELPGVGENFQEHIIGGVSFGKALFIASSLRCRQS